MLKAKSPQSSFYGRYLYNKIIPHDHLTGTSVTSDTDGNLVASIKYIPWGATRASTGTLETEIKFTGQRLDSGVDLYYYGARYYDPTIARFISPDNGVQIEAGIRIMSAGLNVSGWSSFPIQRSAPVEPKALNRYSYTLNNPMKYLDPSGEQTVGIGIGFTAGLFGWGVSGSIIYVESQRGGAGFVWSFGAGGMGGTSSRGGGVSVGAVVQYTTAETIEQLRGWSLQTGGSWGIGAGGGVEYIVGLGYQGVNVNPGAGIGFEMHGILEKAGAFILQSEVGGERGASGLGPVTGVGAGITGDVSFSPGSLVGTDEASNGVVLVSIDGGGPTLVTVDNANSMLREGEDLIYVQP